MSNKAAFVEYLQDFILFSFLRNVLYCHANVRYGCHVTGLRNAADIFCLSPLKHLLCHSNDAVRWLVLIN